LELARAGRQVVAVDKLPGPGQGSTSASSTVVRFNYSTIHGIAAPWEAHYHWLNWADNLEATPGDGPLARLRQTGIVMLDIPVAPKKRVLAMFDELGVCHRRLLSRVPPGRQGGADDWCRGPAGFGVGVHDRVGP
jgi:sarcosine oxidase, subunit beta